VQVRIFPQDPLVGPPRPHQVEASHIGPDLRGDRALVVDPGRPRAVPDERGNYLFEPDTDAFAQVHSLVITDETLHMFEGYAGHRIPWAFRGQLEVHPHKQEGQNAYYSRWDAATNFFYFDSPGLGTTVRTSQSADVVSHETGHAVLDGLRPGYLNSWDSETSAFHEAFGDMAAMLLNLRDPQNRFRILEQTGGDLSRPSILSGLGEQFGKALRLDNDDPGDDEREYLRTALNDFKYRPPAELPPGRGGDQRLTREPHSFSRIFSGAFYDLLAGLYRQEAASGVDPDEALRRAGETGGRILARGLELAPATSARYGEMARALIQADRQLHGGRHEELLGQVFAGRDIVPAQEPPGALPPLRLETPLADGPQAVAWVKAHAAELGLPADEPFEPQQVYSNDRGETFVTLVARHPVPVSGIPEYQGYSTDLLSGLSLVFDPQGRLVHRLYTPLTPERIAAEMQGIRELKGADRILERPHDGQSPFMNAAGGLYQGLLRGRKLIRIPVAS
jgi:hypothetical protein